MAAYREIAAHSAYDMFYKYPIVNLFFSTSDFGVGVSFELRLFLIVAHLHLFINNFEFLFIHSQVGSYGFESAGWCTNHDFLC